MTSDMDRDVTAFARRIAGLGAGERARFYEMSWWSERMLNWAMSHPQFKTRLFHFVDVFPATRSDQDVVRHLEEYFRGVEAPPPLKLGLDLAERVPLGKITSAMVARRNIRRMARQFIIGETAEQAGPVLHRLWSHGSAFTVDLLGEKTLRCAEADRYAARVMRVLDELAESCATWEPQDHLERDDLGTIPRVNLSIKPTALSPLLSPLTAEEGIEQAKDRLRPVLRRARELGVFINLDTEHYDVKDLTYRLFMELWGESEFRDMEGGVVVQAYLRSSFRDLTDLIHWSARRARPLTVRLVKGAYWDAETVLARSEGWPLPVFEHKAQTDRNYERCIRLLHGSHGRVRSAFASHNLRSLAYAAVSAAQLGVPEHGYELQMLYGMAEPIQHAIRRLGLRLRIYAPVGELIPGMAYLVRRLLENTSNESFIRHRFAEGRSLEELIAPPPAIELNEAGAAQPRALTRSADPGRYRPEPLAEWRREEQRTAFGQAVQVRRAARCMTVPAVIDGRRITTPELIVSVDPGNPRSEVARSASGTVRHAEHALEAAGRAWEGWKRVPPVNRAEVLFRAAQWMRERRASLAALEVFEAGKPWKEADADVCEAIDFCEYYGREMIRLDRGGPVDSPPGEINELRYAPRGVGAIIAPWNFPLAIPMGMTAAAVVAGNAVVLKPAEQTPATAWQIVLAFRASGLPAGVLQFLPGVGEQIGPALVSHPAVSFVAFTGSREVGQQIIARASPTSRQTQIKKVVAEMGGKNAMIIDTDADLDQAVPAVVYSAFGYAGQKCSAASRLIILDPVYEEMLERLLGACDELIVGHPSRMGVTVGPLIEEQAVVRVREYVGLGAAQGTLALNRQDVPPTGFYAGPAVITDLDPGSPVVKDEIFGPVLAVLRAGSFEEAVELANQTDYALTAGLYSRSPERMQRACEDLRAGNVYINRPITGAVVGRQPFGGYGMSGVGSKAGGPDYLLQFLNPRTVSQNTLRQGFAPEAPDTAADDPGG